MKRFWPLPVLLLLLFLALPLRAQEGDEAAPESDAAPASDKEEPFISVTPAAADGDKDDETSVEPAVPKKKIVPAVTLMKAPKKGRGPSAAKGAKLAKGRKEKATAPIVKTHPAVVAPEPPPPPVPAVPLTPITPRNP